ncbi:IclR family transcriptional regulator C-terminal domain-containing protein [Actinomadura luteofluorescens]|uniref:IclR family transcriptional regulator domain-containing protein n=1 Tax=Actinomadura luteofluorescens TaxID=46163 RepID=UPI00362CE580
MVFPAHRTTGGLLLLAELPPDGLAALYSPDRHDQRPDVAPDLDALRADLARVRRNGFALNEGRSERGVVAVGVPVRAPDGAAVAASPCRCRAHATRRSGSPIWSARCAKRPTHWSATWPDETAPAR